MSSVRSALALLLCLVTPAFAQGAGAIKGQITGDDGEPLLGANVIVQGSDTLRSTDGCVGRERYVRGRESSGRRL